MKGFVFNSELINGITILLGELIISKINLSGQEEHHIFPRTLGEDI